MVSLAALEHDPFTALLGARRGAGQLASPRPDERRLDPNLLYADAEDACRLIARYHVQSAPLDAGILGDPDLKGKLLDRLLIAPAASVEDLHQRRCDIDSSDEGLVAVVALVAYANRDERARAEVSAALNDVELVIPLMRRVLDRRAA